MLAIYSMIAVQVADLDFVPFWASWRNGKSYQFRDRDNFKLHQND